MGISLNGLRGIAWSGLILAPMLVFALLPDIVLYWKHVSGWNVPQ